MIINKSLLCGIGFFLIFVLFSASNLVVSVESYKIFSLIRFFSFFIVLFIFLFILFFKMKIDFSLVFFVFFIIYFFVFFIFGESLDFFKNIRDIFLIFISSVIAYNFLSNYALKDDENFIYAFFIYYFVVLLILYLTDSFIFDIPPRFNFSFGSELIGRQETYSLGVSNFFGLSAIVFMYGFVMRYNYRWLMLFSSFFALFLSMLGGARGEFLIALLLFAFILFFIKFSLLRVFVSFLFVTLAVFFVTLRLDFEDLIAGIELFNRFEALQGGDLSSRDTLLSQSFSLLYNEPLCLLFGCGPDFFQNYYGYSLDLYPHNSVVEYIISYGFLSFFIFFILAIHGVFRFVKNCGFLTLPVVILLYSFLVSLKSGYLMGSWMLMALIFSFSAYSISKFISKGLYERNFN